MADPITRSIAVNADLTAVFAIWANFENFPRFMKHIKYVRCVDERLSRWEMDGPLGTEIAWDAEITRFDPDQRIAWNSKDNSPIATSGQVVFELLGANETAITVTLRYDPPAGGIGEAVAALFTDPADDLEDDLLRFKRHVEMSSARI